MVLGVTRIGKYCEYCKYFKYFKYIRNMYDLKHQIIIIELRNRERLTRQKHR